MPSITLFLPPEHLAADATLAALAERCGQLCIELLQASPQRVHVAYVAARPGWGLPAYAEMNYRLGPGRGVEVMGRFMEALDQAITQATGLTARIRCFGHTQEALHARN